MRLIALALDSTSDLLGQVTELLGSPLEPIRQLQEALRTGRPLPNNPRMQGGIAQPRIAGELMLRELALLNHTTDQRLQFLRMIRQFAPPEVCNLFSLTINVRTIRLR